jgi:FAD/FMN-containing dehydrogenase
MYTVRYNLTQRALILIIATFLCSPLFAQQTATVVNDVTQLNPIRVNAIITPTTRDEIIEAVSLHNGPVSIGGGRYSMGGQTATEQALHIDMRRYNKIVSFSETEKEITVQAGITWRKVQEFIDPYDLSVKIMQTYSNFTVGGSLSVNVHGRYVGQGPIVLSVKEINLVLANGDLVTASPTENETIFYGAIGGYGGLGVITEVTLLLTNNSKVERTDKLVHLTDYKHYFMSQVRNDSSVVFHNADIYPSRYTRARAVSYSTTSRDVTVAHRLKPINKNYRVNKLAFKVISDFPAGKWMRQHMLDPLLYIGKPVEWRNYEASYDVLELEPKSRRKSTYVLQEYFVPVDQFESFYPTMARLLKENKVNVINISIRHSIQDPGTKLAWAKSEVFAFVIYYKQGTRQEDKDHVKRWTQQLVDGAIACNGSYYLPYQINATQEQFLVAYPEAHVFFALKKELDPTNKFRNRLWDAYYN